MPARCIDSAMIPGLPATSNGKPGEMDSETVHFSREIEISALSDTVLTQNSPESCVEDMSKWPKRVKHRNKVLAKIYGLCQGRESYRVTRYAAAAHFKSRYLILDSLSVTIWCSNSTLRQDRSGY